MKIYLVRRVGTEGLDGEGRSEVKSRAYPCSIQVVTLYQLCGNRKYVKENRSKKRVSKDSPNMWYLFLVQSMIGMLWTKRYRIEAMNLFIFKMVLRVL